MSSIPISTVPASQVASGTFIEHTGGQPTPQMFEQRVIFVGSSNTLGDGIAYQDIKKIVSHDQATSYFGADSELTQYLLWVLDNRQGITVYAAAIPALAGEARQSMGVTGEYTTLFANMGDEWFSKLVLPYFDEETLHHVVELASKRMAPEIHRALAVIAPSNLTFDEQLELPKRFNSPVMQFVYYEDCPLDELGWLAITASTAMAANDLATLMASHVGKKIGPKVTFRRAANYTSAQSNALVQAGSSWMRVDNINQLELGDICTTYRIDKDGLVSNTWMFAEYFANYQFKVFDIYNLIRSRFSGKPFMPDNTPTTRSDAVSPIMVKAAMVGLIQSWVAEVLSVDAAKIIASLSVGFHPQNPTRIDISLIDIFSVSGRVVTAALSHGFYEGAA